MTDPADPDVLDAGLQAERTRLAWTRTSMALTVVGALLLHGGLFGGYPWALLPGVLVLGGAVACYLCGVRRYVRVREAIRTGRGVTQASLMLLVSAACVVPGLLVLAVVLLRELR